jgi:amidase
MGRYQMTLLDTDFYYFEIAELAVHLRARQISPVEVTHAQLARIASLDRTLASYACVTEEIALAQAKEAEVEIAAGRYRGPLHGVPIAVKDLCWTRGIPTAAGMAILADHRPTDDATVVVRLREAGAVLLGKLQLTEGAYSDHHPSITPPKNPWNRDYWPGMSSSGPGAAVAAGLCYGALGSDTGGSIRFPSGANGLTGLKPTWGRVSRYGAFELAASLDHLGPMARSTVDAALLLGAIAGGDPNDPTALQDPVPDYREAATRGARGLRVGIDRAWNEEGVDDAIRDVLAGAEEAFRALGAEIVEVQFPDVSEALADWFPICAVEAALAHEATYPARRDDYGPVLASVLDAGRALDALAYEQARRRRSRFTQEASALLATIDVLLAPVHPFAPPTVATMRSLGAQADRVTRLLRYTCPFDLTGHPTLTMPGGFSREGLPIGFQLVAASLAEATLIRAGAAFQQVTSWHRRHPPAA